MNAQETQKILCASCKERHGCAWAGRYDGNCSDYVPPAELIGWVINNHATCLTCAAHGNLLELNRSNPIDSIWGDEDHSDLNPYCWICGRRVIK